MKQVSLLSLAAAALLPSHAFSQTVAPLERVLIYRDVVKSVESCVMNPSVATVAPTLVNTKSSVLTYRIRRLGLEATGGLNEQASITTKVVGTARTFTFNAGNSSNYNTLTLKDLRPQRHLLRAPGVALPIQFEVDGGYNPEASAEDPVPMSFTEYVRGQQTQVTLPKSGLGIATAAHLSGPGLSWTIKNSSHTTPVVHTQKQLCTAGWNRTMVLDRSLTETANSVESLTSAGFTYTKGSVGLGATQVIVKLQSLGYTYVAP